MLPKMPNRLLICVICLLINDVHSILNGNCELENVSPNDWITQYSSTEVNDNHTSEFDSFKAANVKSVQISATSSIYSKYFQVVLTADLTTVIVSPSSEFKHFEQYEISNSEFMEINVNLQFQCQDGSGSLAFYQPIKDLNTFPPKFNHPSYTYELPMPLPAGFNIACLGYSIEVCDYDITNTALTFTINPPDDFSVDWEGFTDEKKKCHRATITTKKGLRLTEDAIYEITATDVGNPKSNSSVALTIKVDEQTSFPSNPQFDSASYKAIYNSDDQPHSLTVLDTIRLEKGYSGIILNVLEEYKDYFDAKVVNDQIDVSLKKELTEDILQKNAVVHVTIEATLDDAEGPGKTVLVVQLPVTPPNPQFDSASYDAIYNSNVQPHSFTVLDTIGLQKGYIGIKVNVEEEYKDYFDAKVVNDQIDVSLKKELTEDILQKNAVVHVTIEATLDDAEGPGKTVLVVQLPVTPPNPQFDSASYDAIYNSNVQPHSFTVLDTIGLQKGYIGIKVNVEEEYKYYFDAKVVNDKIDVSLKKELTEDILQKNAVVHVTIEATLDDAEGPGKTVLVVQLPVTPPNPQFDSASYDAIYNSNVQPHSFTVLDTIGLQKGYIGIKVNVEEEYKYYFDAKVVNDQIDVSLKKELTEDILQKNAVVHVTIEATLDDAEGSGKTVLVVQLPVTPPNPQFDSASYDAIYNSNVQPHSFTVLDTIRLEKGYSGITFNVLEDYKEYFDAIIDNDQIAVSLIKDLPEEILQKNSDLHVTIEAILENAEGPGRTVLVIQLPKGPGLLPSPQFDSVSYTANYNSQNEKHSISVDGPIHLKKGYSGITVNLLGDYIENFEAKIQTDQIIVTLKTNLGGDVLTSESSILITIEATLDNSEGPGITVLVVHLPKNPGLLPSPEFESVSYIANYNAQDEKHSISVEGPIHLKKGYSGITVNLLGDYIENFEAKIQTDQIIVTLKTNLGGDVLTSESSILITIEATLDNSEGPGRTVLVVHLPKNPGLLPSPEFESVSYIANYNAQDEKHSISVDGPIHLKKGYSGITVNLLGDYIENFEAKIQTDQIIVTLKTNLGGDVLTSESSILITIEATLDNSEGPGRTVLVVHLPKNPGLLPSPEFESVSYIANYNAQDEKHSISVDGPIHLKKGYSGITVNLLGDYIENFEAKIQTDQIIVTLKTNLGGDVLTSASSILITIEATLDKSEGPGRTVLVIQLPKDPGLLPSPEFESVSYIANYNAQDEKHSISVDGPIHLKKGYSGITVNLLGDYIENFEAKIQTDQIIVTLKTNLGGDVLTSESSILITIEATLDKSEGPGRTVLVIQLPKDPGLLPSPEFESVSYIANYNAQDEKHSISVDGPIHLKKGYSGITVNLLGDYIENFEAKIQTDQIIVTLKTNLGGDVLTSESSILITIEATLDKSEGPGRTVLVIQLPKDPGLLPSPEFESVSYIANYNAQDEKHSISVDGPIHLKKGYSGITVNLLGDYIENFEAKIQTDQIIVTLKTNLGGDVLTSESSILITIEATLDKSEGPGRTVLVIQLPKDPGLLPSPEFESVSYIANYNAQDEKHSISVDGPIHLKKGYSGITVNLLGDYIENFEAKIQTDQIIVTLKTNLGGDVLTSESSILITIEATLDKSEGPGRTVLVIQLPKDPGLLPSPEFESVSYIANYNAQDEKHSISVDGPIHLKKGYSGITVNLLGDYIENFEAKIQTDQIIVTLKTNLGGDVLTSESSILITIEATLDNSEGPGRTVLVIQLPKDPDLKPAPQFESASYTATYNANSGKHTISVDGPIRLKSDYSVIKPSLQGEHNDNFEVKIEENLFVVSLIANLPDDVLTKDSVVIITIEAELENAEGSGKTALVIEILKTTSIQFERDNYWFETMHKYEGFIGYVRVTAVSQEAVKYSFKSIDGFQVPNQLEYNENTGAMKITKELDIGKYPLIAVAKGVTSNIETTASVVINIYSNTGELHTTDSLIVVHVLENSETDITLPCEPDDGDCDYEDFEQYPPTTEPMFEFRDGSLHCNSLDREMDEVKNMLTPQFTVSLRLTRVGSNRLNNSVHWLSKTKSDYGDDNREWVYIPKRVVNKADHLLVSVIIDDVNDNTPIFEGNRKLVVGYPMKELSTQLAPPYLTKVHATDLDVGENADIKYTTTSTYFTVHPKTGVVYPMEDALEGNSNIKFTITATDLDGHKDGRSTHLEIEVIPLDQKHLAVLTIKNIMLEDVDDALLELSEKIDMQMKYLTAAVVPGTDTDPPTRKLSIFSKSKPIVRASSDCLTRIVVYALNSEDEPMDTEQLKEKLEEEGLEDISIDKWKPPIGDEEDCDCISDNCEEPSTAGFIAAISVLASLLIIFIIAVAAFYYFKIYRVRKSTPYATMQEEETGSIKFEKKPKASFLGASEEIAQRRPTGFVFSPPPIEDEEEDEFGERKVEYANPVDFYVNIKNENNKNIYDNPVNYNTDQTQKNKDDAKQLKFTDTTDSIPNYDLIRPNEAQVGERIVKSEDSPPEQRDKTKSVSFKPTVEKINIAVDDKPDDVFDERL